MAERKTRMWARMSDLAFSTASGATNFADLLLDYKNEVGINEVRGVTVGTMIFNISVLPGAIVGVGAQVRAAVGIGVFPAGAQPSIVPGADSWPWMWYWEPQFAPTARETSAGTFRILNYPEHPWEVHVRSMRKLRVNEDLMIVSFNGAGASMVTSISGNILLLK